MENTDSPLSDKVKMFNTEADKHVKTQALNPFTQDNVQRLPKPTFSKEDYGRPVKGSKTEARGQKASAQVCKEMLQLCEIIDDNGESLYAPEENVDDPRKIISFGELFNLYTVISNKLVGMLIRTRKYGLIDFEGEVLFQRRDDDVPIVLLKNIQDIRRELKGRNSVSPSHWEPGSAV